MIKKCICCRKYFEINTSAKTCSKKCKTINRKNYQFLYRQNPENKMQKNKLQRYNYQNNEKYRIRHLESSRKSYNERYRNDPEFRKRKIERDNVNRKWRYCNDPNYRKKRLANSKERKRKIRLMIEICTQLIGKEHINDILK